MANGSNKRVLRPRATAVPAPWRRGAAVALVAWLTQLAVVLACLYRSPWGSYWVFRDLYHPGLRLFAALGRGVLPGRFFSPIDHVGVLTGLAFAALVYALGLGTAYGLALLLRRRVVRGH
jgi:hypothetical protein